MPRVVRPSSKEAAAAMVARIEERAESQGLSVKRVSEDAGCGKDAIGGWKARLIIPRADHLQNVAVVLMTTAEYLLTGRKPRYLSMDDAIVLDMASRHRAALEGLDEMDGGTREALERAIVEIAQKGKA